VNSLFHSASVSASLNAKSARAVWRFSEDLALKVSTYNLFISEDLPSLHSILVNFKHCQQDANLALFKRAFNSIKSNYGATFKQIRNDAARGLFC
jgi:hypothetical protein